MPNCETEKQRDWEANPNSSTLRFVLSEAMRCFESDPSETRSVAMGFQEQAATEGMAEMRQMQDLTQHCLSR